MKSFLLDRVPYALAFVVSLGLALAVTRLELALGRPIDLAYIGLLDDRSMSRSTLISSQLPVENWHSTMAEPTVADAILDRLVHNAYRIALKGDSMRKVIPEKGTNEQEDQG